MALRAPLRVLGGVLGLAAGSLFMPDGCAMNAVESMRLRIGLPLVGPLLFAALAAPLLRRAGWRAVLVGLGGVLSFALCAVVLYGGPPAIALYHLALAALGPLLGAA